MSMSKHRRWAASSAVVASITAAALLGTAVPASATVVVHRTASSAAVSSVGAGPHGQSVAPLSAPASDPTGAPEAQPRAETRSWASIIRNAINALKKIPALWRKVVDGAKGTYASFKTKVWPAIKAAVGVISTLVTAWDIWKYFN